MTQNNNEKTILKKVEKSIKSKNTNKKKRYFLYTLSTALLIPFSMLFTLSIIASMPEAPQGDTTFAWIGLIPYLFLIFISPVIFVLGAIPSRIIAASICLMFPLIIYAWVLIEFGFNGVSGDGIPINGGSIFIYLLGLAVSLIPGYLIVTSKKL